MNTMSLTTLDRGKTTVDAEAIEALSAQLRGTLLQQGDAAYNEARTVWNATVDRRPGLIVCCVGASDVIRAVNFARKTGFSSPCAAAATTLPAALSAMAV